MSSYLNIYVQPKVKEEGQEPKKMLLYSTSRSSDLYQSISESGNFSAYTTLEPDAEEQFYELTSGMLDSILEDSFEIISRDEKRLQEYEKYAAGNAEIIEEIIDLKNYLEGLKQTRTELYFIRRLVEDVEQGFTDFGKVFINIS